MKFIVTLKARLKMSLPDSKAWSDNLFNPENIKNFKMAGNYSHHAYIDASDPTQFMATDFWEVQSVQQVKDFYDNEQFRTIITQFADGEAEIKIYEDQNWISF